MRAYIRHLPNAITCCSIALSFSSCLLLIHSGDRMGIYVRITLCSLLFSLLCDFLDGRVARYFQVQSTMGQALDSLHDILIFGAIIAFFYYTILLYEAPIFVTVLVLSLHVVACTWRLAKHTSTTSQDEWFAGMPTPFIASLFLWLSTLPMTGMDIPVVWFLVIPVMTSIAMLLPLPCPTMGRTNNIFPNLFCAYAAVAWIVTGTFFYLIIGESFVIQIIGWGIFNGLYIMAFVYQSAKWLLFEKKPYRHAS